MPTVLTHMENACVTWDFTAFFDDIEAAKIILRQFSKRWIFQQEKCPTTDKLHLQGKVSLIKKARKNQVIDFFKPLNNARVSVTTTVNRNDWTYVTKLETRVAGPWSSDDPAPIKIPIQYSDQMIKELRPWQQSVLDKSKIISRHVNLIVDTEGCSGKSTLVGYACCRKLAQNIPFCNDFRDIMRMIMDKPESNLYFIDLPRALKKDKLNQMFSGIEQIKGGYAFDDRYSFREKWFDAPEIWVFTNVKPKLKWFTPDRWLFWEISNKNELVKYTVHHEEDI